MGPAKQGSAIPLSQGFASSGQMFFQKNLQGPQWMGAQPGDRRQGESLWLGVLDGQMWLVPRGKTTPAQSTDGEIALFFRKILVF